MASDDLSPMQRHDQVDAVSLSPDGQEVILTLVETRLWDDGGGNLLDMQEKLKNYLHYVESGQLQQQYPETEGRTIRFRLDTEYAPNAQAKEFILLVTVQWLAPASIEWEMSLL